MVADAPLEIHSWVVLVVNGLAVVTNADDVDTLRQGVQHLLQPCTLRLSQFVAVESEDADGATAHVPDFGDASP